MKNFLKPTKVTLTVFGLIVVGGLVYAGVIQFQNNQVQEPEEILFEEIEKKGTNKFSQQETVSDIVQFEEKDTHEQRVIEFTSGISFVVPIDFATKLGEDRVYFFAPESNDLDPPFFLISVIDIHPSRGLSAVPYKEALEKIVISIYGPQIEIIGFHNDGLEIYAPALWPQYFYLYNSNAHRAIAINTRSTTFLQSPEFTEFVEGIDWDIDNKRGFDAGF